MNKNLTITFQLSRKRAVLLYRRMWLDQFETEDPEVKKMAAVVTRALRKLGVKLED